MNIKKIPYTICDKCIAFKEAFRNKDYQKFLELSSNSEAVKKAEQSLDDYSQEFLTDIQNDFNIGVEERNPPRGKCPFDYKPNLKIQIRKKYRMKCFSCGHVFGCPVGVIHTTDKYPICEECEADYYTPNDDYDLW